MEKKYKVVNITVKPLRKDKHGKDKRSVRERRGYPVQFTNEQDMPIILAPGRQTIVNELTPALLNLQRGGHVNITTIEDIATALKDHTLAEQKIDKKEAEIIKKSNEEKPVKASAVEMGAPVKEIEGDEEAGKESGASNPDGKPNFLAQTHKVSRKARKAAKKEKMNDNSNSSSDKENEQG